LTAKLAMPDRLLTEAADRSSLSLARCRQLIGRGCSLTDDELVMLRDHLTALADIVTESLLRTRNEPSSDGSR